MNDCGCTGQSVTYIKCPETNCVPPVDCDCPISDLKSDCIIVTEALPCAEIEEGQTLTETLLLLDQSVCDKIEQLDASINLISTGNGAEIYNGIDNIGRRKIKSLTEGSNIIEIVENADDVEIGIDDVVLKDFVQDNQKTYSIDNIGTGVEIYKDSTIVADNEQFNLRSVTSTDLSVTLTQSTNTIDLSVNFPEIEAIVIEAGTGIDVTGVGTVGDPFIITNTDPDQTVSITDSGIANVTGTYPNFNIDVPAPDGSETNLVDGVTTDVSGAGTVGSPYIVEVNNLQKSIGTFPYTLLNMDDKYTIFIDNGVSNVVINVPDTLPSNYSVAFIQEGTGDVTFTPTGTAVIETAVGLKIKGQFYWALLEKKLSTITHYLVGSTKL